jgi:hypothetical protein
MSQSSNDIPLTKTAFRNWMRVRMQELKRTDPTLSKKSCWRAANSEWLELRRRQKQATRKALLSAMSAVSAEQITPAEEEVAYADDDF